MKRTLFVLGLVSWSVFGASVPEGFAVRTGASVSTLLGAAKEVVGGPLDTPLSAFTFEPALSYGLNEAGAFELYSAIQRSSYPFVDFGLPKTLVSYQKPVVIEGPWAVSVRGSLSLLNLEVWETLGHQIRPTVAVEVAHHVNPDFTLGAKIAGYVQSNRDNNPDFARHGFHQKLFLEYEHGDTTAEAAITLEERMTANWKMDFATLVHIRHRVHENLALGFAHEIISSVVDDSTSFYQPTAALADRAHRFSGTLTFFF